MYGSIPPGYDSLPPGYPLSLLTPIFSVLLLSIVAGLIWSFIRGRGRIYSRSTMARAEPAPVLPLALAQELQDAQVAEALAAASASASLAIINLSSWGVDPQTQPLVDSQDLNQPDIHCPSKRPREPHPPHQTRAAG